MAEILKERELLKEIAEIELENFSSPLSLEELNNMYNNERYMIYIEKNDEKIAGYLIIHDSFDVFEIIKTAVKKDKRRLGIAQKLIEFAFEQMEMSLFLEVRETNIPAQSLYKKLGFQVVGERKGYYSDTGEKAILMLLNK